MKSPINYYGGKAKMIPHILPLIPEHSVYTESFAGGLSVFFAKSPAKTEIVNDTNAFIANFYQIVVDDFDALKKKIDATLYCRATYKVAMCMYDLPRLFSSLQQAWAFFVLTNLGFSGKMDSFGCYTQGSRAEWFERKKKAFTSDIVTRLEGVQIENTDALRILSLRDTDNTFHYVDPPYVGTDCAHYGNYTEQDFEKLLDLLSTLKGKFLLSSFPSRLLTHYTEKYGWYTKVIQGKVCAPNVATQKDKAEILTANYPM